MNHFDKAQWMEYIHKKNNAEIQRMEAHLLQCDECLKSYLELIEESVEEQCSIDSSDFTAKIMKQIKNERKTAALLYKRKRKKELLIYYSAAVCAVLILVNSGVFKFFNDTISSATLVLSDTSIKIEHLFRQDWPVQMMEGVVNSLKFSREGVLIHEKEK